MFKSLTAVLCGTLVLAGSSLAGAAGTAGGTPSR